MQTFLPYNDINLSVKVLDWRRLGKQRVEAMQILNALEGRSKGWTKHPATLMWKNYENCLKMYTNACIIEWINRGYKNNMKLYIVNNITYPLWFGDARLHDSHKSNLLRKDVNFYSKYNWDVPNNLVYYWPTKV